MERNLRQIYWQKDRQQLLSKRDSSLDAKNIGPLFKVRPNLSDLVPSRAVFNAFSATYPQMDLAQACLVDGSIIIQDINPQDSKDNSELNNQVRSLNETSQCTIQLVDAKEQTETLIRLIKRRNCKDPLYVFPGNGAQVVSEYIKNAAEFLDICNSIYLPTSRTLIKPGEFRLRIDFTNLPDRLPENVIIIDDVVATGQTIDAIAFKIKNTNPKARIISTSWIFLYGSCSRDINGYQTSLALKGNYVQRPPINSLSCLTSPTAKYDEMKIAYAQRYFTDAKLFGEEIKKFQ